MPLPPPNTRTPPHHSPSSPECLEQQAATRADYCWHTLKTADSRQDNSPQSMFYSSAPSVDKPDRTIVPCSTVLPPLQRTQTEPQSHVLQSAPLQRNQTGQQSPEHVLQFCPLCRETRQNHSPQEHVLQFCPLFGETRQGHSPQEHFLQFCPLCR